MTGHRTPPTTRRINNRPDCPVDETFPLVLRSPPACRKEFDRGCLQPPAQADRRPADSTGSGFDLGSVQPRGTSSDPAWIGCPGSQRRSKGVFSYVTYRSHRKSFHGPPPPPSPGRGHGRRRRRAHRLPRPARLRPGHLRQRRGRAIQQHTRHLRFAQRLRHRRQQQSIDLQRRRASDAHGLFECL